MAKKSTGVRYVIFVPSGTESYLTGLTGPDWVVVAVPRKGDEAAQVVREWQSKRPGQVEFWCWSPTRRWLPWALKLRKLTGVGVISEDLKRPEAFVLTGVFQGMGVLKQEERPVLAGGRLEGALKCEPTKSAK